MFLANGDYVMNKDDSNIKLYEDFTMIIVSQLDQLNAAYKVMKDIINLVIPIKDSLTGIHKTILNNQIEK